VSALSAGLSQLDRPVSIALIEDQDVVVEGVRSWVAADPGGRAVVTAVGSSIEAVLEGPGRAADYQRAWARAEGCVDTGGTAIPAGPPRLRPPARLPVNVA
jgi:hypothetical protein